MLRRLRETGPVLLVPLAWTFTTAVHLDLATEHALFIAHLVMATIIAAFAALSWSEMADGVLLAWRRVLVIGFSITVAGVAGFLYEPFATELFAVSIIGWMVLPAVGLAYTGQHVTAAPLVYTVGAALSLLGALVYAASVLSLGDTPVAIAGLTLVNVGQTAGIVNAAYQY